jgi:hypothetical protein
MMGVSGADVIRETAGARARAALHAPGLMLCSMLCSTLAPVLAPAQAACNGSFRDFAAGLTIEEGDTPPDLFHPYRPVFLTEDGAGHAAETVLWRQPCGNWAIRSFELHTKVRLSGGPDQDRLVGRPAATANGPQRAGYSTGGGDAFVVPLLLLARPGADDADLGDRRVNDVRIYGRQPFQQLKFMLPDSSVRRRWMFRPVSAALDAGGAPAVVHFVVSCGEASCTGGELAEAARLAEWHRHLPPR